MQLAHTGRQPRPWHGNAIHNVLPKSISHRQREPEILEGFEWGNPTTFTPLLHPRGSEKRRPNDTSGVLLGTWWLPDATAKQSPAFEIQYKYLPSVGSVIVESKESTTAERKYWTVNAFALGCPRSALCRALALKAFRRTDQPPLCVSRQIRRKSCETEPERSAATKKFLSLD